MTNESMSTQHINLAEAFPSFADYAASTASLPQTAATSLDVARFHAFTGELTFSVDPAVRLYLDGGNVYHAEREGDQPVSHLLLDAGVIDSTQLQRGVVSVGQVEHLGRLFDRDTSIDRDAVMVVLESATESLLQQIANSVIASVSTTAYRHHPSGIHRWFVAPAEPTSVQRPASGVMQVDRSVVEELPRLDGGPAGHADGAGPAGSPLRIHWDEPDASNLGPSGDAGDRASNTAADMDIDIEAELDRFDADRADWSAASSDSAPNETDAVSSPLGEFRIVWPDGTQDASLFEPAAPIEPAVEDNTAPSVEATLAPPPPPPAVPSAPAPMPAPSLAAPTPASMPAPAPAPALAAPTPVSAPAPDIAEPASLGFTMKPLQIDRIPEPDSAVPDGVAAAVRRALQAIENATSTPTATAVPELHLTPVALPELSMPTPSAAPPMAPTAPQAASPAPVAPSAPAPAQPLGFAPPTMATSAEAVYERAAAQAAAPVAAPPPAAEAVPTQSAAHVAPTPFADDGQDAAEQRRGALERLIGSLRIKD